MANRAFQLQLNNLVERLTLLQCRFNVGAYVQATGAVTGTFVAGEVVTGGTSSATGTLVSFTPGAFVNGSPPSGTMVFAPPASAIIPAFQSGEVLTGGTSGATVSSTSAVYVGAYNLQGNGFQSINRAPVATGTGVLGSYQIQLSDSYNYLMGFDYDIVPPGINTAIADGSFVVGGNYQIAVVGTQNFVGTLTIASGTATATIGGFAVVATYASSATVTAAALAAAINVDKNAGAIVHATSAGAVLTLTLLNPNPPVAVPITLTASAGSWSLGLSNQASAPATSWHYLGLPASVVPVVGATFQALHTGSLTHAGDGTAASQYALAGTTAAANLLYLQGLVDVGLQSSTPGVGGGYLNMQSAESVGGAAQDLPVGAIVRLRLLLRNSKIKGKGE